MVKRRIQYHFYSGETKHMTTKTLDKLSIGAKSIIVDIKADGSTKQRLQDLGFINGALVESLFRSPLGDPTAYKIKGTTIALRIEEANKILIE